ncbi:MAG TPA: hypothetical protein VMT20_04625 [Terriglobia bacterium]|nr:hypothetical protein [Terriglobia bacterium]
MLKEQLSPFGSPEQVIGAALETLTEKQSAPLPSGPTRKSPDEAVADILEIQKRNRLGGLKIKDLMHEVAR